MSKEEEASSTEPSAEDTKTAPEEASKSDAPAEPLAAKEADEAEAEGEGEAEGEADGEGEGEDEGEEPEKPAEKPVAKAKPATAKASETESKSTKARVPSNDQARHAASKPHSAAPTELPTPAAGLGKSLFAFFAVMFVLAAGFWVLGTFDNPFGGGPPKWRVGQSVSVELTLDPADDTKLSCASETEIAGKRCEYETKTKRHEKKLEDKDLLRPYSLADNSARLLAAGVWSGPELDKASRPKDRFNLKCDFKVEGEVKAPAIRWDVVGAWNEKDESWFAGSVVNCKLVK